MLHGKETRFVNFLLFWCRYVYPDNLEGFFKYFEKKKRLNLLRFGGNKSKNVVIDCFFMST